MQFDTRKLKCVITKRDEIIKWLDDNAPFTQDEQKQLDAGTTERAYWHYGYQAALSDMINLMAETRVRGSADSLN